MFFDQLCNSPQTCFSVIYHLADHISLDLTYNSTESLFAQGFIQLASSSFVAITSLSPQDLDLALDLQKAIVFLQTFYKHPIIKLVLFLCC